MKTYKNIRFIVATCFIVIILTFLSPSLLGLDKGKSYINHFFTSFKKPKIIQDEAEKNRTIEEDRKDKNTESDSLVHLSKDFVKYSFEKDEKGLQSLLSHDTFYIRSPDGSSFLRYVNDGIHVEGYMATDRSLSSYRQRWFFTENDTAVSGMEIKLRDKEDPLIWFLHFKKEDGVWKIFMLENEQ